MVARLLTPPRRAVDRAVAGKRSFFALLLWLVLQPLVVWAGNPHGLVVLTIITLGVWAIAAAAALLPRAGPLLLLLVAAGVQAIIWLGLSVFLGLLFFPMLGGSLALWLYWRDVGGREERASATDTPSS